MGVFEFGMQVPLGQETGSERGVVYIREEGIHFVKVVKAAVQYVSNLTFLGNPGIFS